MKINTEPVMSWFGFTRRERRSSFILLAVIVVILCLRLAVAEKNTEIEDFSDSIKFSFSGYKEVEVNESSRVKNNLQYKYTRADTAAKKKNLRYYQKKSLIDLNSCDTTELISLPGIGAVLSARIIKYRNLLGGYASVNQLREVYGLPAETFNHIKDRLFADTALLVRISVNSAGYKEFSRLPYFEKYEIQAILKYRELKGRIGGVNELVEYKLIPLEKAEKVKPYLKID
jgi:DNA uptake protein ComE-like DNA-binding protein